MCWDNVQKLSVTRHHLRQDNKMMLWALCFAAKNRISFRHLDDVDDKCSSIQDWRNLQKRMECVVQNIVQKNFPQFSEAHVATIQHQYSDISEDSTERQEMFEDICKRVVQLVWPKIDMKSIQQAAEGDVVQDSDSDDDPQYLDDTILY